MALLLATAVTLFFSCQSAGTASSFTPVEETIDDTASDEGLNLDSLYIVTHYVKKEYMVPMRD